MIVYTDVHCLDAQQVASVHCEPESPWLNVVMSSGVCHDLYFASDDERRKLYKMLVDGMQKNK